MKRITITVSDTPHPLDQDQDIPIIQAAALAAVRGGGDIVKVTLMLAGQRNITPDRAFTLIRDHARANNNKLLHDAQNIINGTLALQAPSHNPHL